MRPLASLSEHVLSVDDRLNFHQTCKSPAKTTWVCVSKKIGDVRQSFTWIDQHSARDLYAYLIEHFAVAGAHASKMTLQRARANFQSTTSSIHGCVTMPQGRDDSRADRLGGGSSYSSHRFGAEGLLLLRIALHAYRETTCASGHLPPISWPIGISG